MIVKEKEKESETLIVNNNEAHGGNSKPQKETGKEDNGKKELPYGGEDCPKTKNLKGKSNVHAIRIMRNKRRNRKLD